MWSTSRSRKSRWCRATQKESERDKATDPSASCAVTAACRIASLAESTSHRYPSSNTMEARATRAVEMLEARRLDAAPR